MSLFHAGGLLLRMSTAKSRATAPRHPLTARTLGAAIIPHTESLVATLTSSCASVDARPATTGHVSGAACRQAPTAPRTTWRPKRHAGADSRRCPRCRQVGGPASGQPDSGSTRGVVGCPRQSGNRRGGPTTGRRVGRRTRRSRPDSEGDGGFADAPIGDHLCRAFALSTAKRPPRGYRPVPRRHRHSLWSRGSPRFDPPVTKTERMPSPSSSPGRHPRNQRRWPG